jgi:hypothetical protein
MKTFNRTSLPMTIKYNKRIYTRNDTESSLLMQGISLNSYINCMKLAGRKVILCNVLSRNLKGKTDLHGQPYKPTQWVFIHKPVK